MIFLSSAPLNTLFPKSKLNVSEFASIEPADNNLPICPSGNLSDSSTKFMFPITLSMERLLQCRLSEIEQIPDLCILLLLPITLLVASLSLLSPPFAFVPLALLSKSSPFSVLKEFNLPRLFRFT
ncbi:hypothetical protein Hanom_Chr03g00275551 [Helianthus anomalus]